MSWLEPFGVARIVRLEYEQTRKQLAELRGHPVHLPASDLCRRCGCDLNSCREYGCIDQGEPMTTASMTGRNDAASCITHVTDRMRG
jgi:hypothetical protein